MQTQAGIHDFGRIGPQAGWPKQAACVKTRLRLSRIENISPVWMPPAEISDSRAILPAKETNIPRRIPEGEFSHRLTSPAMTVRERLWVTPKGRWYKTRNFTEFEFSLFPRAGADKNNPGNLMAPDILFQSSGGSLAAYRNFEKRTAV
jgi:hypothetical protein